MVADLGPWRCVGRWWRLKFWSDQGLTSVTTAGGSSRLLYRGGWSLPHDLKKGGWTHIGAPDSFGGSVVDAVQGRADASSKLFRVTAPNGAHADYEHSLDGDERMNNSYVALSPDGNWMLSGEWDRMERILLFPSPLRRGGGTGRGGGLERVGTVDLDHPVRNVQGATFVTPTRILCSTDDPDTDLWPVPWQLLQIDLPSALDGRTVEGQVTSLGALPLESPCRGTFEVEGLNYNQSTGDLRVVIIPPSPLGQLVAAIYRFRQA